MLLNGFKTFDINLNARHVNGMTHVVRLSDAIARIS